eukprot:934167-Pleurochrysis_carterae.AAC.5
MFRVFVYPAFEAGRQYYAPTKVGAAGKKSSVTRIGRIKSYFQMSVDLNLHVERQKITKSNRSVTPSPNAF